MQADTSNIDQLAALLKPNTLVLTPNQRLSRALTSALSLHLSQQNLAWHTPVILPLNTWLQTLANKLQFEGLIPAKPYAQLPEELDLWRQVISESDQTLVRPKSVAKLARAAYISLQEWQLAPDDYRLDFDADEDTAAYRLWHKAYEQKVLNQSWQTHSSVSITIAEVLETIEQAIILVGFHDLAPLYKTIVDKATSVQHFTWAKNTAKHEVHDCKDRYAELADMARWAYDISHQQPQAKIALCIPDLNQARSEVLYALDKQFQPEALIPGNERQLHFYDISAGVSLSNTAIGHTLLLLLQLLKRSHTIETWIALLQSPYCQLSNTLADVVLARVSDFPLPEANLGQLAAWLGEEHQLTEIHRYAKNIDEKLSLEDWSKRLLEWAEYCGWPGKRTLSSDEYQQHQICLNTLEALGQLRLQKRQYRFSQAADILNDMFNDKVYHAETPATNISVLGSLEASGQVFDYLWITGMDDSRWPAKLSPSPFIPLSLQQQYHMPRGSVTREYDYAASVVAQFTQAAEYIVTSYEGTTDGVKTSLSRLLNHKQTSPLKAFNQAHIAKPTPQFEPVEDTNVPLLDAEHTIAASALVEQSHCAFKAFASRRLKLKAPVKRQVGLSAMERGNLLHTAFEIFFSQCRSRTKLQSLSHEGLNQWVLAAAQQAVNRFPPAKKRLYNPVFFELETQRLAALLHEWLAQGDVRITDYEVCKLEHSLETCINGLNIHLRIDRIDVINDQWFVLDYKSGTPAHINWYADRLSDPQLPLYAVALADHKVCGIAVAYVKPNEASMNAVGAAAAGLDKTLDDQAWQALINQWRQQIEQLAEDYQHGTHQPDPIKPVTCDYCDFSTVCRIFDAEATR